jgi:hypothetical protein
VSYLLYCILKGHRQPARPSLKGVGGHTVWMLECEGLCAALSEVPQTQEPSGAGGDARLNDLIAYAKTIEAFNRRETVVPMRYGCCFATAVEVRQWIRGCAGQLRALLERLDGCIEMGIRALPLDTGWAAALTRPRTAASGTAYLAARRGELALAACCDQIAMSIRAALTGRFRQCVMQVQCWQRAPMVSLFFLVEREGIGAFREAFGELAANAALMLSGPWPPYNFVGNLSAGGGELDSASGSHRW